MKILITILVATSFVYAEKLTQDFLKGFETGILIRDDPRALHDYSCPEPDEPETSFVSGFTKAIGPMNMMAKLSKDPRLESVASKITLFVTTLNDVMGIFDEAYDAGDFCRGLIFGKDGAKMLYEIA